MSIENAFGQLPPTADRDSVQPYTIKIPEDTIQKMRTLIDLSPIAEPCYENQNANHKYGITRDWVLSMKQRWLNEFSWRTHEAKLNSLPQFMASVRSPEGNMFNLHFTALFSTRQDAIPIVLCHGWPGSFLEFVPMLELIQNEHNQSADDLQYHFIVPSLPGFGFSSMPPFSEHFYRKEHLAEVFDRLMTTIFGTDTKYIAQGGDVGSYIARILASKYENCLGAHLNFSPVKDPSSGAAGDGEASDLHIEDVEKKGLERGATFSNSGTAYANMQGTRPSTLGFVLSSNPIALLAWIGEKMVDWSDPASFSPLSDSDPNSTSRHPISSDNEHRPSHAYNPTLTDHILLNTSLYWLTQNIKSTFYTYRETLEISRQNITNKNNNSANPPLRPATHDAPDLKVAHPKMLGYSWFPMEVLPTPVSWVATSGNLVWSQRHEKGGHFAALEGPKVLWGDLRDFVGVVLEKVRETS